MEIITRNAIAKIIFARIETQKAFLKKQFQNSENSIGYFFIDDLLPIEIASKIQEVFPKSNKMLHKKTLREDKFIAAQMNKYNPILEEIIYAFQDKSIVNLIGEICNINEAIPDENLYAGGISMMGNKQFLNPHLDNSPRK